MLEAIQAGTTAAKTVTEYAEGVQDRAKAYGADAVERVKSDCEDAKSGINQPAKVGIELNSTSGTGAGSGIDFADSPVSDPDLHYGVGVGSGMSGNREVPPLAKKVEKKNGFGIYKKNLQRNNPEKYGYVRQQVALKKEQVPEPKITKVFADPYAKRGDPSIHEIKTSVYNLTQSVTEIRRLIDSDEIGTALENGNMMFKLERLDAMCSNPRKIPKEWGTLDNIETAIDSKPTVKPTVLRQYQDGVTVKDGVPIPAQPSDSLAAHAENMMQM